MKTTTCIELGAKESFHEVSHMTLSGGGFLPPHDPQPARDLPWGHLINQWRGHLGIWLRLWASWRRIQPWLPCHRRWVGSMLLHPHDAAKFPLTHTRCMFLMSNFGTMGQGEISPKGHSFSNRSLCSERGSQALHTPSPFNSSLPPPNWLWKCVKITSLVLPIFNPNSINGVWCNYPRIWANLGFMGVQFVIKPKYHFRPPQ